MDYVETTRILLLAPKLALTVSEVSVVYCVNLDNLNEKTWNELFDRFKIFQKLSKSCRSNTCSRNYSVSNNKKIFVEEDELDKRCRKSSKIQTMKVMDELEDKNIGSSIDDDNKYINIHFVINDRKEIACFQPDHVTDLEIKELFRSAAEAGPLDIVKLRKGDKLLNISSHLPENEADDPYVLQVVCVHPATSGMIEAEVFNSLERRVMKLEQEICNQKKAMSTSPCIALQELQTQVNMLKKKLETTEHLSWLGFYKQLPHPISSEACRRLQYRRKSDSVKRTVREKFLNICDVAISSSVREWLKSPTFDARQWEDEELLLMLQTMFVELDLLHKFSIPLSTLRNFIYEVYNNYNEVPFHNFRHCFCVAQMMYVMVWAEDLMTKIGELEVLVLIVSCICHDLDHPGYNNIYQINARTELALRYNDISPLENHHCSVAFRILEAPEFNILGSLDSATYRITREGIIRCILATDMARHNEILAQFTEAVPNFDFSSKVHINLLSMVLIKVADISNEARPMDVAEPWLDNLLQEFFKQSDAEKLEGLPVTPFMDRDKVTKPSSQCSFIGHVLLPLFEILGELFPGLQELIVEPVRYALDYYRRLNEAAKDERLQRKSIIDLDDHVHNDPGCSHTSGQYQMQQSLQQQSNSGVISNSSDVGSANYSVVKSISSHSVQSKRSTTTLHSRSRSIEDDTGAAIGDSTYEEIANLECSDSETATEVEVSEKTLKFKISTEGNCSSAISGRKSYPNSRKGSRERSSLDNYNYDFAKAMREHERERERWRNRGEEFKNGADSGTSALSFDTESQIPEELKQDDQSHKALVLSEKSKNMEENGNLSVAQQRQNNHISKQIANMDTNERKTTTSTDNVIDSVQCCCDDRLNLNNHKSFLSRLRNLTDRLSMSFDSRDALPKSEKYTTIKVLNKSITINNSIKCDKSSSDQSICSTNNLIKCKRCHSSKTHKHKEVNESTATKLSDRSLSNLDQKRSMTLPKVRRTQDNKNKSWRTVFSKKPSMSLEILPVHDTNMKKESSTVLKHRRNLSNPVDECHTTIKNQDSQIKQDSISNINFEEINIKSSMPEILIDSVNSGDSCAVAIIDKVEIRRSSASMEDISKITNQSEIELLGGSLENHKSDECQQHTGSLDSVLNKETACGKQPVIPYDSKFSCQSQSKKLSPGLFSRFKSGMSIDSQGNRSSSNSGSIHEQQTASWLSSITATFRARRQVELPVQTQIPFRRQQQKKEPPPVGPTSHEEVK